MAGTSEVRTPVLIVGAGPTGLVLALGLTLRGIACRIIDEHDGPGQESRAMVVHARTLEFYRQFGFADEVVSEGIVVETVHLHRRGHDARPGDAHVFHLNDMGAGSSPYPFALTYPQDFHEKLLIRKLRDRGVDIERGTKLSGFVQDGSGVRAHVETAAGPTTIEADYIVGCDGARSRVRETLGFGFAGGTYTQTFYVADVKIESGFDPDMHVNLGASSLALMLPVRMSGMQRLIGLVPTALHDRRDVTFEDLRGDVEALVNVKVAEVNWFSTYRVHHRVADRFRDRRAFIAGDAGHLHSPAGGQGMNTGIGDAINLGWKLADVVRGRAGADLLDTYEPERMPFARRLVATTDRAFEALIDGGLKGDIVREWITPAVVGLATRFDVTRHLAFRTLSQIAIAYHESPLSEGEAGLRGGDRLPFVPGTGNFDPLRSLDWQVHVYGDAPADLDAACRGLGLPLHALAWSQAAAHAGLKQGAAYLVRPDGYVALAADAGEAGTMLRAFCARIGLRTAA